MSQGRGGTATGTSSTAPQAWTQPYAKNYLGQLNGIIQSYLSGGYPSALNTNVAGFSGPQTQGMNFLQQMLPQIFGMAQGTIGQQQGLLNQAGKTLGSFASGNNMAPLNPTLQAISSGQYLGSNPFLNSMYQQAATGDVLNYQLATQPALMAEAQQAGAFNSSGFNQAQGLQQYGLGQSLGTMGANLYGNAYQSDMQNMLQAAEAAQQNTQFGYNQQMQGAEALPGVASSLFNPAQGLLSLANQVGGGLYGVGSAQQQQQQNQNNAFQGNSMNMYSWPFNLLSMLGAGIGQANMGGGTAAQQTSYPGQGGGILPWLGLGAELGGSLLLGTFA